jgi:hypothetical protein
MRIKLSTIRRKSARLSSLMLVLATVEAGTANAGTLDTIGLTLLRQVATNLNGAGLRIAQPEASLSTNSPVFEVNPAVIGQPAGLITYTSADGTSTNYPNAVGAESGHANSVASLLFGRSNGVATNVAGVDNYDADYFIGTYVDTTVPPNPGVRVINQSFTYGEQPVALQQYLDTKFDNAAAAHNTLFISGADNSGIVKAPATAYNGLGVGAYGGSSAIGPTPDNGRCKPDLTAPESATSFSTPLVSGAATILLQAGLRGDGGPDTNAAADLRTLKALLLNGTVKPAGWTNGSSTPLDARYGAGVLNVFNSYMQLAGGKHTNIAATSVTTGNPHPPTGAPGTVAALSGWNFTNLSSSLANDQIHHYYFDLTNSAAGAPFTATATLVWNRQQNQTDINDLDLFLYDCATSNLVAQSISGVDNVEHLFVPGLPPGRYDLQVWKAGGTQLNGRVTGAETYALAWEFFTAALTISISTTNTNAVVTWPIYPDGFAVQAIPSLTSPVWSTLNLPRTITNGGNRIEVPLNSSNQFFRLRRPN